MKYKIKGSKLFIYPETKYDFMNCGIMWKQGGFERVDVGNSNPEDRSTHLELHLGSLTTKLIGGK